ncbi:MAG TPA: MaoC/PaaZ C-terminal domain-containing protein [Propionicimonas sp.]|jgi:acyl dehydratase|uniref:MaoC family dehydratase n=1 Tax=Propionicimonas sp. TaxID=1955623 RepID=UPI002F40B220
MTDREVDLLPEMPALVPLFARALLPDLTPGPARIPERTAMVVGLRPDPQRLADYDRVCGFALRTHVPPTWLHVLTFPLHIHLLGGPDSTIRLAGSVHVANHMRLHRPVSGTEVLDAAVRVENLRPHRRGAQLDVISELRADGELVWDGVSTYLSPGAQVDGTPDATGPEPFAQVRPLATWRLPADLGRDYRRVSGDPNPIHTSRLAARAFGFARSIAHGMWTHARLLAALEPRLPEAYTVEATFARPILLPSTVGARWHREEDGWTAAVTTRDGAKPYLLVTVRP